LNVAAAQLGTLNSNDTALSSDPHTLLVINVLDAGDVTFRAPNWGFIQGKDNASRLLFNFPHATTVRDVGSSAVWGTVLAPHATYVDTNSNDIEGAVVVRELIHGAATQGGQLHTAVFTGSIDCPPPPT